MKRLLASAAFFALGSATVLAADLPVRKYTKAPPPPVATVYNWTGFYVGGHVGGAWANYNSAQVFDGGDPGTPDLHPYPGGKPSGVFGGVQAGYNWQFNRMVLGIEGDLGYMGVSGTNAFPADANGVFDGSVGSVKYGAYGVIAGRVGVAFDRALFYGKGGGAFADIKNRSYEIGEPGAPPIEVDEDHRHDGTKTGWALGVGGEYAFNNNWSAKIEYLHMDFGKVNVRNLEGDIIEFSNKVDTVKVGLNYHFVAAPVVAKY
jgi:outer membrane immunogenic protein